MTPAQLRERLLALREHCESDWISKRDVQEELDAIIADLEAEHDAE